VNRPETHAPRVRFLRWQPAGEGGGPLCPEELQVCWVEVNEANLGARAWLEDLSGDERRRAERFRFAAHRDQFILGRGVLRHRLAAGLGCAPHEVRFVYGPQGRPELEPAWNPAGVVFSVSHVPGLVVLAFALRRRLGVDVETTRRVGDWQALAARVLSARERLALAALPPEAQTVGFLRAWTIKEACLKATGRGLTDDLDRLETEVNPALPARLLALSDTADKPDRWTLRSFNLGADRLATLAWAPREAPAVGGSDRVPGGRGAILRFPQAA
jgi:4'-phosphopantetheinyl transferase